MKMINGIKTNTSKLMIAFKFSQEFYHLAIVLRV